MKILMVCLGNICRSPLAEGILRSKLDSKYSIDSAGTGGWHIGVAPDKRSVAVANKHGIDISNLRARIFQINDFEEFDLIFVMDESNFKDVSALALNEIHQNKIKMILGTSQNVPDPYWGTEEDFEAVYQLLDQATDDLIQQFLQS